MLIFSKPGHDEVVIALQDVVGIDPIGIVCGTADGPQSGAVIAEPNRFSPSLGAVAIGPVDGLVAEKDYIPFLGRDCLGVNLVGMIGVGRQMRSRIRTQDMLQGSGCVAAGYKVESTALQRSVVKVEQAIDKVGPVVGIEWVVLMHGEWCALLRRFCMHHGMVPLDGGPMRSSTQEIVCW